MITFDHCNTAFGTFVYKHSPQCNTSVRTHSQQNHKLIWRKISFKLEDMQKLMAAASLGRCGGH